MRYYLVFGLPAAVIAGLVFFWMHDSTDWHPYILWLIALSVTTLGIYGLDKALSKTGSVRVPENLLNVLALLGGFPGGWLGMALFHHKSNLGKHPTIWLWLALATVGHLALAFYWFVLQS
jgi:uncharacterized membrane protein YsdA (DUF1294 family)